MAVSESVDPVGVLREQLEGASPSPGPCDRLGRPQSQTVWGSLTCG
jgi:hypothetical protein